MVETAIGDLCVVNRVYRIGPRLRMKLMVIPVGRSLVFELQLSQILRPILKRFAGHLARYANIDILKTSEEENILGNLALSPPAEATTEVIKEKPRD